VFILNQIDVIKLRKRCGMVGGTGLEPVSYYWPDTRVKNQIDNSDGSTYCGSSRGFELERESEGLRIGSTFYHARLTTTK
jgi:hypothetical protein